MENWILKGCLQQLLTIYVYAEQQYVHLTVESLSPILHVFFRERAFERSDFILEIQRKIDSLDYKFPARKTIEEFYSWHNFNYGTSDLNHWPFSNINMIVIDEKALEICTCLLNGQVPNDVHQLIEHQTTQLVSSLLSLAYLKALQNKR